MKEQLEKYIKGLLEINKEYKESGVVLVETDSLYSPKWLENTCKELLEILEKENKK